MTAGDADAADADVSQLNNTETTTTTYTAVASAPPPSAAAGTAAKTHDIHLSAKDKAEGIQDAAALLLQVTFDDPVEALETIAEALRFRHRWGGVYKRYNEARERMTAAAAAGIQSSRFISEPHHVQLVPLHGGAQNKPNRGAGDGKPAGRYSVGNYRAPSSNRERRAELASTTGKAPGQHDLPCFSVQVHGMDGQRPGRWAASGGEGGEGYYHDTDGSGGSGGGVGSGGSGGRVGSARTRATSAAGHRTAVDSVATATHINITSGDMSSPRGSSAMPSKRRVSMPHSPYLASAAVPPPLLPPRSPRSPTGGVSLTPPSHMSSSPPSPGGGYGRPTSPPDAGGRTSLGSPKMKPPMRRPGTATTARVSVSGGAAVRGAKPPPVAVIESRPRPGSSVGFVNNPKGAAEGEHKGGGSYAPSKEQVNEWKKAKEKAEDDKERYKEEAIRRVITKDREFIEQIQNTKRPWRQRRIGD